MHNNGRIKTEPIQRRQDDAKASEVTDYSQVYTDSQVNVVKVNKSKNTGIIKKDESEERNNLNNTIADQSLRVNNEASTVSARNNYIPNNKT